MTTIKSSSGGVGDHTPPPPLDNMIDITNVALTRDVVDHDLIPIPVVMIVKAVMIAALIMREDMVRNQNEGAKVKEVVGSGVNHPARRRVNTKVEAVMTIVERKERRRRRRSQNEVPRGIDHRLYHHLILPKVGMMMMIQM